MYEAQTYNAILSRMLGRVPSSIDKREGSVIYNALAPAALELAQMYIDLDQVLDETFADTASRYYLIRRAQEHGLYPKSPTYAILKGVFNCEVPTGARFSGGTMNYFAEERITEEEGYVYRMQCETEGEVGNSYIGKLVPIETIDGLKSAELTEILIHGEDAEATEAFRQRYLQSIASQSFGGNKADYMDMVHSLQDVGGCRVYPAWNGGGTVKIVFVDSEYGVPSEELVDYVQGSIDPLTAQGEGVGMAPIGHVVTVEGATEDSVTVSLNCTCGTGYSWDSIKADVQSAIEKYFDELNSEWSSWEDTGAIIVRITQLESRILDVNGVIDVTNTAINGLEQNHEVPENKIVKLEALTNGAT